MSYRISLTLVLTGVWLAWSGRTEPLILALGAASIGFVVWLSGRMKVIDSESVPIGLRYGHLVRYIPWLALEMAKSNLDVARRVLAPGPLAIAPRLIRVPASQQSELAQVIYANSITLTPGTVSIDVRDGVVLVHALHAQAAAGLEEGEMNRKCAQLESEPK